MSFILQSRVQFFGKNFIYAKIDCISSFPSVLSSRHVATAIIAADDQHYYRCAAIPHASKALTSLHMQNFKRSTASIPLFDSLRLPLSSINRFRLIANCPESQPMISYRRMNDKLLAIPYHSLSYPAFLRIRFLAIAAFYGTPPRKVRVRLYLTSSLQPVRASLDAGGSGSCHFSYWARERLSPSISKQQLEKGFSAYFTVSDGL